MFSIYTKVTRCVCSLNRPTGNTIILKNLALRRYLSQVELTSVRYPEVKRGNYASLLPADVDHFTRLLGPNRVITDSSQVLAYNTDWLKTVRGMSNIVLRPKTTEEVSKILTYCSSKKLAVCPQGGNTGLVGGSVPVFDEVVVSLQLMNRFLSVDELSGVAVVEAGCVLEKLDNALLDHKLTVPIDLGAKGSCHIGGNVATNAGGIRLLRYGSLHGSVLGLKVVLANGDILDLTGSNRKDNTGYDMKQLFIGSEGTLGIVTEVVLQCPPKPSSTQVAFLATEKFDNVLETMLQARRHLGEILSSCEFMDHSSMECVTSKLHLKAPVKPYPFYVLLETSGSNEVHDAEKLEKLLDFLMNSGRVSDGTMATDGAGIKSLWALRERIAEALVREGYVYKYDVSVPVRRFYEPVDIMRERLGERVIRCCGFGHLGDGNLHLNFTSRDYSHDVLSQIEPFIYEWVSENRGSISAEHGLGFKKRNCIHYSKSSVAVEWMRRLKDSFDPNRILNPYKVLPD